MDSTDDEKFEMPNTKKRKAFAAAKATMAAIGAATLASGCGVVSGIMNDGVENPITPEQSKAQVIDAAKDIVATLNLEVVKAVFWRASCNDQGEPPYRGEMRISYPLAPNFDASVTEADQMIQQLRSKGWTDASDFHSHSTALTKGGVVALLGPQSVSDTTRGLELFGECRDMTTDQNQNSMVEVDLSRP